jgi:hypothetical protein
LFKFSLLLYSQGFYLDATDHQFLICLSFCYLHMPRTA